MKKIILFVYLILPLTLGAQLPMQDYTKVGTKGDVEKNIDNVTQDLIILEKMTKPVTDKIDSIYHLLQIKYKVIKSLTESDNKKIAQNNIDNLEIVFEKLKTQQIASEFNFVKQYPSSYVSLDILSFRLKRHEGIIYYDTIESLFNTLSMPIQSSRKGNELKLLFINMDKSMVGSLAPDFSVKDINDFQIRLSDFRDKKYVLLDFWASWCGPCRDEIPSLKNIYKMYKDKGLEIIGISQDANSVLWKNAIAKDSTQIWKHILVKKDGQKVNSFIIDNYFVYGIPVKVLINKDGEIIGRWRGGGAENEENLKKLLQDIFE